MMGFDRVDRYISRVFWTSYLAAFLFFFGAFMVIDLFSNMDEFVETAGKLGVAGGHMLEQVVVYYLYSSPAVFLQVAPFVTVIGVIVCVARLLQTNELVPILMSGRSVFRMLRPVFVHASLLTLTMILMQEAVAPRVGEARLRLDRLLKDGAEVVPLKGITLVDDRGQHLSGIEWNLQTEHIEKADLWSDTPTTYTVAENLRDLRFDPHASPPGWRAARPFRLRTVEMDEPLAEPTVVRTDFLATSLDPRQITAMMKDAFDLSFRELGYLEAVTGRPRYRVLLHYHITFPLTNILLLLLALPFMLRYERRTRYVGLAMAFLLCFLYFGADFLLRSLGENHLHPVLAAWFTPIFFGALGISLFDGVRT